MKNIIKAIHLTTTIVLLIVVYTINSQYNEVTRSTTAIIEKQNKYISERNERIIHLYMRNAFLMKANADCDKNAMMLAGYSNMVITVCTKVTELLSKELNR